MIRLLTLCTLFPDATRPLFGSFVERRLLQLQARGDVDVQVVAPIGIAPFPLSLHPKYRSFADVPLVENWKGLTVHRPRFTHVPGIGGRLDPGAIVRSAQPIMMRLRAGFDFDLIEAQFFFPDGPAAVALGKVFDVPSTITARGGDIHFWGERDPSAAMVRTAGRDANGVIAVSRALADDMEALGIPQGKVEVIYPGIDQSLFAPVDRAKAKALLGLSGPVLLSVGSLDDNKGQKLVIEALSNVPNATYLIAGKGPERAAMEALAERCGVSDHVRFLGAVPYDALPQLYSAADAFVLPSGSEGTANVWLEAIACGTPLVICAAGGAREIVTHADAGLIVERNPEAIAAGVNALLNNPPTQEATVKQIDRFTWDRKCAALKAHYQRLLTPVKQKG